MSAIDYTQSDDKERNATTSRRRFIGSAAFAAAGLTFVPQRVFGANDRLNIAGVGLGAMGCDNLQHCRPENIVALCDVDWRMAGQAFRRYPDAKKYRDYRRMLDQEKNIDAVVIATPDHSHAVITAEAMKRGKHVYTQMPLTHTVREARQLARIAREIGVTTQMAHERHTGPSVRRLCEWIWDGAIGQVRHVKCWTHRPTWQQGMGRPQGTPSVPSDLNWDLWLGPAPMRPYHPAYHPYNWRAWQDFGGGALGDTGCDILDGPFWALKLNEADQFFVDADTTPVNSETYPNESTITYRFPGRGDMAPVTITWYDGGRRPPKPEEFPQNRTLGSNGSQFIGDEGKIAFGAFVAGTHGGQAGPRLLPESEMRSYDRPPASIPRVKPKNYHWQKNNRDEQEWIEACKNGTQPSCNFDYAGPLTEMVLLGNVAALFGGTIEWDRKNLKVVNEPRTNKYVRREYRGGWSL